MADRQITNPRISTSVVISTAGVSTILDLGGYKVAAIHLSTAWSTGNGLGFAGGDSTGTLYDLWTSTAQVGISSGLMSSAAAISFTPVGDFAAAINAHRYLQIRAGVAVASTISAERTIGITLIPPIYSR